MISLCTIVKNEEGWIGDFIDHLRPLVQEFIIGDTGSTDATAHIARQKNAQIFELPWEKDFSKARNLTLEKAHEKKQIEWILVLDPDIRIAATDLSKLKNLIAKYPKAKAFRFPHRNYVRNIHLRDFQPCRGQYAAEEKDYPGYFEDDRIALFRNSPEILFEGIIHETVNKSVGSDVVDTDIVLHHYGLDENIVEQKNKRSLYQELSEKKTQSNPQDFRAHVELGMEYMSSQQFEKAVEAFEKARKLAPGDLFNLRRLGNALLRSQQWQKMEAILAEGFKLSPNDKDIGLLQVSMHMEKNEWATAKTLLQKMIAEHEPSFKAHYFLAFTELQLQNLPEAEKYLRSSLSVWPQYPEARLLLFHLLIQQSRWKEALEIFENMPRWLDDLELLKLGFETALRAEDYPAMEKLIRIYLKHRPEDEYALAYLTTALLYQFKFQEMLDAAKITLVKNPKNFLANFNCGVFFFETKNWPRARQYLELAHQLRPDDPLVKNALERIPS